MDAPVPASHAASEAVDSAPFEPPPTPLCACSLRHGLNKHVKLPPATPANAGVRTGVILRDVSLFTAESNACLADRRCE